MTAALNVNLKKCSHTCPVWRIASPVMTVHSDDCSAAPALIPRPIPRSVTFTVTLGECDCVMSRLVLASREHVSTCPARPIRVSCSISGKTWEDSFVSGREMVGGGLFESVWHHERAKDLCLDRWELVKALVLGASKVSEFPPPFQMVPAISEMLARRDAVYAALADMARAEETLNEAMERLERGVRPTAYWRNGRPSEEGLLRYVERLIEQVGAL